MFSSAVRVVRRGWTIRFGARETLIFFLPATFLTRSGLKISCTRLKRCKNTRVSATKTRRLFSAATQDDSTRFLKGNNRAINKRSTVEFPFAARSAVAAVIQSRSRAETTMRVYGSSCTDRKRLNHRGKRGRIGGRMEKRNIRFRTAFILWVLFSFYLAGPARGAKIDCGPVTNTSNDLPR